MLFAAAAFLALGRFVTQDDTAVKPHPRARVEPAPRGAAEDRQAPVRADGVARPDPEDEPGPPAYASFSSDDELSDEGDTDSFHSAVALSDDEFTFSDEEDTFSDEEDTPSDSEDTPSDSEDRQSIASSSGRESPPLYEHPLPELRGKPRNYHPPDPWGGFGRVASIPEFFRPVSATQEFWILRERNGGTKVMLFREEASPFNDTRGPLLIATRVLRDLQPVYCIEDGHFTAGRLFGGESTEKCFAELLGQGSKFTLRGAPPPLKRPASPPELAVIRYPQGWLGRGVVSKVVGAAPRHVEMLVPPHGAGSVAPGSLRQAQKEQRESDYDVYHSKLARWDAGAQSLALDFRADRVSESSVKNVQLTPSSLGVARLVPAGSVVVQFGKAGHVDKKDAYILDVSYPMSVMQAFALALAQFEW